MSRPYSFWNLPYQDQMWIRQSEHRQRVTQHDADHWRKRYETLVKQTGRDVDDGLGLDPRVK